MSTVSQDLQALVAKVWFYPQVWPRTEQYFDHFLPTRCPAWNRVAGSPATTPPPLWQIPQLETRLVEIIPDLRCARTDFSLMS